jgi:hypothetical protein
MNSKQLARLRLPPSMTLVVHMSALHGTTDALAGTVPGELPQSQTFKNLAGGFMNQRQGTARPSAILTDIQMPPGRYRAATLIPISS